MIYIIKLNSNLFKTLGPVLISFKEELPCWHFRFELHAHHVGAHNLSMERVYLLGRGRQPVLRHSRDDLIQILSELLASEVVYARRTLFERLGHSQYSQVVSVEHLFVLFSC